MKRSEIITIIKTIMNNHNLDMCHILKSKSDLTRLKFSIKRKIIIFDKNDVDKKKPICHLYLIKESQGFGVISFSCNCMCNRLMKDVDVVYSNRYILNKFNKRKGD